MSILFYNIFGIYIKKNKKKISGRCKLTLIFLKSLVMIDNVIKWLWLFYIILVFFKWRVLYKDLEKYLSWNI